MVKDPKEVDEESTPERVLSEEKDEELKNLENDQGNITTRVIITPYVTNPSPAIILLSRIRSLYNNNYIKEDNKERRDGIITSLVTIASSRISGRIVDHLLRYGACTIPELANIIPTTKATASRTLQKLLSLEVTEIIGSVGAPYRSRRTPGPRIPIYALKGADPKASIDAQKRYGEIVKKLRGILPKQINYKPRCRFRIYMGDKKGIILCKAKSRIGEEKAISECTDCARAQGSEKRGFWYTGREISLF